MRRELPSGSVTFMVTDVEGRLHESTARHDELLRRVVESHRGAVFRAKGSTTYSAFASAHDALGAALQAQDAFASEAWSGSEPIRIRIALDSGNAIARNGEYDAPAVARAARLASVGYGGRVLVSSTVAAQLPAGARNRLKDLGRSERVFEILPPNNLPSGMAPFIGRTHELAALRDLASEHRIVTIVAPGGMGKTRLALQFAGDALDEYDDGCWFVRLAAIDDPAFVANAIADALRIDGTPNEPIDAAVLRHFSDKRALLVLDDSGHVAGGIAEFSSRLLEVCPKISIVITNREPLGFADERVLKLGPLSDGENLFYERARAVRPDLAVSDAAAGAIRDLCAKLHGVPLAIELAAAHVATLASSAVPVAQEPFDELDAMLGAAIDRERTLRGTLDWSYRHLDREQQRLLARLAIFEGSFTEEACTEVAGTSEIDALVHRSLVTRFVVGRRPRYRLHHVVRDFALVRLRDLEGIEPGARRLCAYERIVSERLGVLERSNEEEAIDRIAAERKNLHAALRYALEQKIDPAAGRRIALALWHSWTETGRAAEGKYWIEAALRSGEMPALERIDLLYAAATIAHRLADFAKIEEIGSTLIELCESTEDAGRLAKAYTVRAGAHFYANQYDDAQRFYEKALEQYRAVGDDQAAGVLLMNLGALAADSIGDFAKARAAYDESLRILQGHGISANLGTLYANMGELARREGNLLQALSYARSSLGVFERLGNVGLTAWGYVNTAKYRLELGELEEARKALQRARSALDAQPNPRYEAVYLEVAEALTPIESG